MTEIESPTGDSRLEISNRAFWLTVIALTALAAILRFYRLETRGVWIDEISALRDARGVLAGKHPPHYLHFWMIAQMLRFGDSPFWLRLPSALLGIAGVPALAWALRRWSGGWTALIGAAWIAISPYHLYHSIQARYYAEVIFCASLSMGALAALAPSKTSRPRIGSIVLFIAANAAACWIHPTALVFFAIQAGVLFVLWTKPLLTQRGGRWRIAGLLVIAAVLALVIYFVGWQSIERSNLAALLRGEELMLAPGVGWRLDYFLFPAEFGTLYGYGPFHLSAVIVLIMVVRGWESASRAHSYLPLFMWTLWLGTLLAVVIYRSDRPFDSKYAAYIYPFWVGLGAWGIYRFGADFGRTNIQKAAWASTVLFFLLLIPNWSPVRSVLVGDFDGYKRSLQIIESKTDGPQAIYTTMQASFVMRYYKERDSKYKDIDIRIIRELNEDRAPGVAEANLLRLLNEGEQPWLVITEHWDPPLSMESAERIAPYFNAIAEAPAMNDYPGFSATIFHAKPVKDIPVLNSDSAVPAPPLFDAMHPSGIAWNYESDPDGKSLHLPRNIMIEYPLDIRETGRRRLNIRARHDAPFTLLEAGLDGKRLGLLGWMQRNGEWETQSLDFATTAGKHKLQIAFISDRYSEKKSAPDLDSDAWIRSIEAVPVDEGDAISGASDITGRLPLAELPQSMAAGIRAPYSSEPMEHGWQATGNGSIVESKEGAIGLRVEPTQTPFSLLSPRMRVSAGAVIYGEIWLRVEDLDNHSANIIGIIQSGDGPPQQYVMYATGLTGTTDWARFPFLIPTPRQPSTVQIAVTVYANSARRSDRPGALWVRDLHFHSRAE